MEIRGIIKRAAGGENPVTYRDVSDFAELAGRQVRHAHGYCFFNGKLVLVFQSKRKCWEPAGGGLEAGESPEEATIREIREESNMRVLKLIPIGYQEIQEPDRLTIQTRSFCIVEPIGAFENDPDGDIEKIALVDPADYKKYFDWGAIGDRVMERALELLAAETEKS